MKTTQWLIAAALTLTCIQVQADTTPESRELNKALRKQIQYPAFAKQEKMQGMVAVKYEVQSSGNISVLEINASHQELEAYVRGKLEEVTINDRSAEGIHYVKFVFRFVNI